VRARRLREQGVLGMNRRNLRFIMAMNPRRLYPRVDDKLAAKAACARVGVATPALVGVILDHRSVRRLAEIVAGHESFVVKPTRGSQGNGILVIRGRDGQAFTRSNGRRIEAEDVAFHVSEILSGLFSLAGQRDRAMIEECLAIHPELAKVTLGGVPDIRLIVYRGIPAMAMIRLPTATSGGRANLHQGAVGAGIDLDTGRTTRAVLHDRVIHRHPDTEEVLVGIAIPRFQELMHTGVRAADEAGLGYLGVDLVADELRGPVVLEMNARPGLAIQLANDRGLLGPLRAIDRRYREAKDVDERVALGREIARDLRGTE
jgi:alpha-L-glutamate ligase-like protein